MDLPALLSRISLDRPITSYSKVQRAYAALVRGRKAFVRRDRIVGKSYLNVGCGPFPVEDMVNLDYTWSPKIDVCWDIAAKLPFESASFDGVFTEHCLDMVPFETCKRVLVELKRVLKPRGTLRVVLADAEIYLDLYQRAKSGEAVRFPYQTPAEVTPLLAVNRTFIGGGHVIGYDVETLTALLRGADFVDIRRCAYREGKDARLLIDREDRAIESMYVEASVR